MALIYKITQKSFTYSKIPKTQLNWLIWAIESSTVVGALKGYWTAKIAPSWFLDIYGIRVGAGEKVFADRLRNYGSLCWHM